MANKDKLKELPKVDDIIKSPQGLKWLDNHPRKYVLQAVRETIDTARKEILAGNELKEISIESFTPEIEERLRRLSSLSLIPVINATGIVIHTNLGRSILSKKSMENISKIGASYSNLEYDIDEGKRGKRNSHIKRLLKETTGAEDGVVVNNNAGAVLLVLTALAKGKEAVVSRGELVEIGGSFRVPDVMSASGAILKEVGTTNKTHLYDYHMSISENTGLILKIHPSNYRITGFTEEVSISELSRLGRDNRIPVMYDLGGGCLIDLKPYGIHGEPTVQEAIASGADVVTFSGDKLLGGPQAGIIVGKTQYIEQISKHPLMRALRLDKLTLGALESTFMEYADEDSARKTIPTLRMLTEPIEEIHKRAKKIALALRGIPNLTVEVIEDFSQAGGGSLPEVNLKTDAVSLKSSNMSPNKIEERLRKGAPSVIARINEDRILLDARTVLDEEVKTLVECVKTALR